MISIHCSVNATISSLTQLNSPWCSSTENRWCSMWSFYSVWCNCHRLRQTILTRKGKVCWHASWNFERSFFLCWCRKCFCICFRPSKINTSVSISSGKWVQQLWGKGHWCHLWTFLWISETWYIQEGVDDTKAHSSPRLHLTYRGDADTCFWWNTPSIPPYFSQLPVSTADCEHG